MAGRSFPLGNAVSTPGALEAIERAGDTPLPYLVRHAAETGEISIRTTKRRMNPP